MFGCDKGFCHFPLSPAVHCRSGVSTQTRWWQRGVSTRLLAARMARTQVGGKWKGPRDPTKEARIQAAIRDTLTGVHGSFHSAAVVSTSSQPLLSGHPNSHSLYYSGLTLATHNTYSIRLLHTSHWYTRIYRIPNV